MLEASLKIIRVFVDFCFTAQKQIDMTIKSTFSNYVYTYLHPYYWHTRNLMIKL